MFFMFPHIFSISFVKFSFDLSGKLVKIKDLSTGKSWYCCIKRTLTNKIIDVKKENIYEVTEFPHVGEVWVHTPLGGAILGRMVGDEFGFYENGLLQKYRILKILS